MCDSGQPKFLDERPALEAYALDFASSPTLAERDACWARCERGDWLLWVAEKAGVPYAALLEVAVPIVDAFRYEYRMFDTDSALGMLFGVGVPPEHGGPDLSRPNDDADGAHWEGHRLHAFADTLHAYAHLLHGTGHHGCGHPALALHHCQVAALMAYQPRPPVDGKVHNTRAEGDRLAKEQTARMVRERMPPPSEWAAKWPEVKW